MLNGFMEIVIGAIIIVITYFIVKRIIGALLTFLYFVFKVGVYAVPIIITWFAGALSPWLLIVFIPLSIGYYFLIYKTKRKFARKKAMGY